MGLASDVGGAVSEGVNYLCALLEWNDTGAVEVPPVDGATLEKTMVSLEGAMREILYGRRIVGVEGMLTDEDLARLLRLKALIPDWPSKGALSPEVVTLAEQCVSALWHGVSWRELMAYARRK